MYYSTYVTTWDNDPYNQIQDMINRNAISQGSRIILAFASFNFSSTDYIPGFNNITIDEVIKITNLVHSNNINISLSVGGATYPFTGSDLYSRPGDLATNINAILNKCNFDGVDFDIEDPGSNVPADFVNNTSSLINTLRSLNSNLNITLTTAAQAWGAGMWQPQVINYTIGNINAWQPMEYDLWIANKTSMCCRKSLSDYYNQIQSDINFYINTWGVNPSKIILGLMPGADDSGQVLSLQNALNLTDFAKATDLMGVMTWDANIDGKGCDGNAPYAYSMGIQSMLK